MKMDTLGQEKGETAENTSQVIPSEENAINSTQYFLGSFPLTTSGDKMWPP